MEEEFERIDSKNSWGAFYQLKSLDERGSPLTPEQKLVTILQFFATGSYQRVTDLIEIRVSTVYRTVWSVTIALAHVKITEIVFPSQLEFLLITGEFSYLSEDNFPGTIGTVNCTHIPIQCLDCAEAQIFYNHKSFYSISCQLHPLFKFLDALLQTVILFNMIAVDECFNPHFARGSYYNKFIRYKSRDPHLSHKEARKSSNIHLNRYKDVYPYDHSRICLRRANTDYINASLVLVPAAKRAYVLTQGPLSTTTGHFWAMVWEQKCKGIVMLNRTIEKNIIKCHQYWPSFQPNSENELHFNDVNLKVANLREEISSNYIIRELLLTDLETGESRILYHFHYITWPDFGVPESPEAFLQFLHIIREKGILDDENIPPVVHCSAGIGRSGTFCLVDSCLVMIEELGSMDFVSVKDLLLEMRKYRMGLIQTPDQLRFSYLAIIEGSKDILIESKPPPLPQKQKLGEILEDKLCLEYVSDEAESEETSEESVSSSCDKSEEEIVSMQEISQEQETQIDDILKEDSETATEFMQRNETVLEENENILIQTQNSSNIVNDTYKSDKTHTGIICEELTSQVIENEICKKDETKVNKSTLEEQQQQSTSYFLSSVTEQLSDDIQPYDKIQSINTQVKNAKLSETNETVLTDNDFSEVESNSFVEFPVIESKNNSEVSSCEIYHETKTSSFENQSENMDSLKKDISLSITSAAINENKEINLDICDRYLEFYQNGDVYSIKTKNEKEKLLRNENSRYLSELSFGNFSSHCNNIKSNDIKISTRSGQRSSSCPRQLPSIVSKLPDKINGKLRKRRNSADSGISSETASPLKLRKTQEIISDDEYESIGKIEKFLEMTSKSSSSDFSEEKSKETFTRSRM